MNLLNGETEKSIFLSLRLKFLFIIEESSRFNEYENFVH